MKPIPSTILLGLPDLDLHNPASTISSTDNGFIGADTFKVFRSTTVQNHGSPYDASAATMSSSAHSTRKRNSC